MPEASDCRPVALHHGNNALPHDRRGTQEHQLVTFVIDDFQQRKQVAPYTKVLPNISNQGFDMVSIKQETVRLTNGCCYMN